MKGTPDLGLGSHHPFLPHLRLWSPGGANRRSGAPRVGADGRMLPRLLGLLSHRTRWASDLQPLADARLAWPIGLRSNPDFGGDRRVAQATVELLLSERVAAIWPRTSLSVSLVHASSVVRPGVCLPRTRSVERGRVGLSIPPAADVYRRATAA